MELEFEFNVGTFVLDLYGGNGREVAGLMRTGFTDDDLVDVGVHNEVRVVRDHNDRVFALGAYKQPNEFIKYRFWIESFFRLVNNQWPVVGIIRAAEGQYRASPEKAYEYRFRHTVLDSDVFGSVEPLRKSLCPRAVVGLRALWNRRLIEKRFLVFGAESRHGSGYRVRVPAFPRGLQHCFGNLFETAFAFEWPLLAKIEQVLTLSCPRIHVSNPRNAKGQLVQGALFSALNRAISGW